MVPEIASYGIAHPGMPTQCALCVKGFNMKDFEVRERGQIVGQAKADYFTLRENAVGGRPCVQFWEDSGSTAFADEPLDRVYVDDIEVTEVVEV